MNGLEQPIDFRQTIASVVVVLPSGCGPNVKRFAETAYETRDTSSVDSLLKDFRVGLENSAMVADPRKQRTKRRFNSDESLNEEKMVGGGFLSVHFGYHLHDFRSRFSNSFRPSILLHLLSLSFAVLVSFISARKNVEDNAEQHRLTEYDSIFRATRFQLGYLEFSSKGSSHTIVAVFLQKNARSPVFTLEFCHFVRWNERNKLLSSYIPSMPFCSS